jgi:hypothetical protein
MNDVARKHGKRIERQDANMPTAIRDMLSPTNMTACVACDGGCETEERGKRHESK